MPRRLRQSRQRYGFHTIGDMNAWAGCPPPWEPIPDDLDEYLAALTAAELPRLLEWHAARPERPDWALVRYHADPDIARTCVDAHRRCLQRWIDAPQLAPWADKHRVELEALEAWTHGDALGAARHQLETAGRP